MGGVISRPTISGHYLKIPRQGYYTLEEKYVIKCAGLTIDAHLELT